MSGTDHLLQEDLPIDSKVENLVEASAQLALQRET